MSFYTDLRDDTAGPLITQFGQAATLRKLTDTYDPALGRNVQTPSNTPVVVVALPVRRGSSGSLPEFSEEQIAQFEQMVLMSAKETAEASVSPAVDDHLIYDGRTWRIAGLAPIAPAGTAVAYKMGVASA